MQQIDPHVCMPYNATVFLLGCQDKAACVLTHLFTNKHYSLERTFAQHLCVQMAEITKGHAKFF